MVHNNNGSSLEHQEDAHLVQDFEARPDTFRIGFKSLNINSVAAANGKPQRVVPSAARHLTREILAEKDVVGGRIQPHLSLNNYILFGPSDATAIASYAVKIMRDAGVHEVRKDCIMAIELIFTLQSTTSVDTRAYFEASLAWARKEFSPAPIISAVVHLDEPHPHMHVLVLPLIGGSMQGGKLLGFQSALQRRLRDFGVLVGNKFGLSEPVAKTSSRKADRKAYAVQVVDMLLSRLSAHDNDELLRAELLKLVVPMPYALGRVLGVPVAPSIEGHATQESEANGCVNAFGIMPADDYTALSGSSTSTLCYDVDAASVFDGRQQELDERSAQVPIYVDNYAEGATSDLDHDDASTPTDAVPLREFVRERESDQLSSTWDSELGCHVESPSPKPSNRAKADEVVARATNNLQSRRYIKPNKEDR